MQERPCLLEPLEVGIPGGIGYLSHSVGQVQRGDCLGRAEHAQFGEDILVTTWQRVHAGDEGFLGKRS